MTQLYGSYVRDINAPCYLYLKEGTKELVSVNHIVRNPEESLAQFQRWLNPPQKQNDLPYCVDPMDPVPREVVHDSYVPLGQYVGPDTPLSLKNWEARIVRQIRPNRR